MSGGDTAKRGRGRPAKSVKTATLQAYAVETFVQERVAAGDQVKVAVADAAKVFSIDPSEVYRRRNVLVELAAIVKVAEAAGMTAEEVFEKLGLFGEDA